MRRLSLSDAQDLARRRGGECLSNEYIDIRTPLQWRCSNGHVWFAAANQIRNMNSWCPQCGVAENAASRRSSIDELKDFANSRGGKLLSTEYRNKDSRMLWQCSRSHRWQASWGSMKNGGTWCPTCSTGIGERICRAIFEALFEASFPKAKPEWLLNTNGNRLELDGYSQKLGIAFERNGRQHYEFLPLFHSTPERFKERQDVDKLKQRLCAEKGIVLIEVPHTVPVEGLERFVRDACETRNVPVVRDSRIDLNSLDVYRDYQIDEMRHLAVTKGGQCLSSHYVNGQTRLRFRCGANHEWDALPGKVKAGCWCARCAGVGRLSIQEMHELARARGGECLASEYKGNKTKLRWRCSQGHEWRATPTTIRNRGSWCPHCAHRAKLTIAEMREIARGRGGECLSLTYVGGQTPLLWRCRMGHEWSATPNNVKNNATWCPTCSGRARKAIKDMQALAASRGGSCLSAEYGNNKSKLRWRCGQGHEWVARPNDISSGCWCPECARSCARKAGI